MKSSFVKISAAVFALALFAGCSPEGLLEDTTPVNDNVGAVSPDPIGGINAGAGDGFNVNDPNGRGGWTDPQQLAGNADADGWTPADPTGKNLGLPVIYFAYDSDVLVPSETANLDKIAAYLQQGENQRLALVIEGHCDNRGTDEYNRALGERRANAIRAYLAGRGISDARMKTQSFGEDKPAVEGSGEAVWRKNRRGVPVPMIMPR